LYEAVVTLIFYAKFLQITEYFWNDALSNDVTDSWYSGIHFNVCCFCRIGRKCKWTGWKL